MLRKSFLVFCLMTFSIQLGFSQTVFWTELFNSNPIATPVAGTLANNFVTVNGTWSVASNLNLNNGALPNTWYVSCQEEGHSTGTCGTSCSGGAGDPSLHVASTTVGDNGATYIASAFSETHDRAQSPIINCAGKSSIVISFNYILNGEGTDDNATLQLFDGTAWNNVVLAKTPLTCAPQGQWTRFSLALPALYNNLANFRIGFLWDNDADAIGTDPSFAVDSINLFYTVVNNQPVAANDNLNAASGTATTTNVLVNDYDPDPTDNIFLNATIVTQPQHGTITGIGSNGGLTYTSTANYCGLDSFQYQICDNGSPTLCDTAWVFVQVGTSPAAPSGVTAASNPVCLGSGINISATGLAGMTLVWTGPSGLIGTGTSISIAAAAVTQADSGQYCVYQYQTVGCNSASTCILVDVNPIPQTPTASSNAPVCTGQSCNLTANPNGSPSGTWSWTGPNAFTSTQQNPVIPSVNAPQTGNYTVTNTVGGCTSAVSAPVNVTTQFCLTPVASFSLSPNDTICSGSTITVTDLTINGPTTWSWNFNSTNTGGITVSIPSSNLQNPGIITFNSSLTTAATVTISLVAGNSLGNSGAFTKTLVILPGAPLAAINASANSVCVGSTLNITDGSSNTPTNWAWSFANSTPATSTAQNPGVVQFNAAGNQIIQLIASNLCGSNIATKTISVRTIPTAQFSLNPPYCNNTPITLYDNTTGSPNAWQWTFGQPGSGTDTSTLQTPTHIYPTAGTYTVQLIAWNICGASSPVTNQITISDCSLPTANFGIPADTVCMNTPIILTDSSQHGPLIYYWALSGASPGISNLASPTVQYGTPGTYSIKLTVQNAYGSSSITKYITVLSCLPPTADFYMPTTTCASTCIDITNISTEAPFTSLWTFTGADSLFSTQINPKNICYQYPGTFTITLVDSNKYGKSNTMVKTITVLPAPRILTPNSTLVAGNDITLNAIGTGTITWMPNVALNQDTGNTVISSALNNIYYTVKDESNCPGPDTVYITMIYQNAVITVPNGFTPDGNGLNDVFRITANQPINQFSMRIFNRWGEEVFHSEDYTQGWDGYHRSKEQNSGVYLYIINYQDLGDGEYKVLNGNLTLIR